MLDAPDDPDLYLKLVGFDIESSEFEYLMRTNVRQPELIVTVNCQPVG